MHLLIESDWSIVLIMTGAVKQIVEEGRILVTVHHIFSTNNGMQNLISALKTSQPNGFTARPAPVYHFTHFRPNSAGESFRGGREEIADKNLNLDHIIYRVCRSVVSSRPHMVRTM